MELYDRNNDARKIYQGGIMTIYQLKAKLQELCDNFYSDYEIVVHIEPTTETITVVNADLLNKRIEIE